jgi:hypothetical protein
MFSVSPLDRALRFTLQVSRLTFYAFIVGLDLIQPLSRARSTDAVTDAHSYPHRMPGPFQRPRASATTFRCR